MNIKNVITSPRGGAIISGCVAALISLFVLACLINSGPIIADGKENLTTASNLIRYGIFSSADDSVPLPDMKREPAWPTLTAGLLLLSGLYQIEPDKLATQHQVLFKEMNAVFLALVVGFASGLAWFWARRRLLAWIIALVLALAALTTMPRLVNYFNNEPLAMLLVLAASALTFFASRGTWRSAVSLGLALGLLALTKAQFLYIAFIPIVALGFMSKKQAGFALLVFALVVTPWLARNTITFGKPAISERGKIVAAVRMIMVTEHRQSERACMAFAFTHPSWREPIGKAMGISRHHFDQGNRCQRFNREIAFDMGIEKVDGTFFPGDVPAWTRGDWSKTVQYFYKGMAVGEELEANALRFSDIAPLTFDNIVRYLQTLPLFAWRGMGFSAFPWLSILFTISAFALIVTRLWPCSVLVLSTHLFHLLFTHNIPRYHAIELGLMIFAMAYLLDNALTSAMNHVSGKDGK